MTIKEINTELEKRNALFTLREEHVRGINKDYDGVMIVPRDQNLDGIACPTLRADLIERVAEENLDATINKLGEVFKNNMDGQVRFPLKGEDFFKAVRPSIFSIDRFEEIDDCGVYVERIDCFAVTYFVKLTGPSLGDDYSIWRVSAEYMEKLEVDPKMLRECAFKNLAGMARFMDIGGMLGALEDGNFERNVAKGDLMYVLTTTDSFEGAAEILCGETTKSIEKFLGSTFYVLPSSRHEVLCIPFDSYKPAELLEMVTCVNSTSVKDEDVLSDHVYLYDEGKVAVSA